MGLPIAMLWFALIVGFAPAGAYAAFPGEDGRIAYNFAREIRTIEPDGSNPLTVTKGVDPSWSPDGRLLVFTRLTDRRNEVLITNADGSGERTIATVRDPDERPYLSDPSFSPSGRRVTYATRGALHTVRVDGRGHRVMFKGAVWDPAFAPSGALIAFTGELRDGPDGAGIWTIRKDATDLRQLTEMRNARNDSDIDYRPDGRRILFQRKTSAQKGAFIMRADGSALRQVRPGTFPYSPVFAPSGGRIAFAADVRPFSLASGCLEVFTSSPGGADVRQVTNHCLDDGGLQDVNLSWQPIP